jgi:AcrR family transcriptional regulator
VPQETTQRLDARRNRERLLAAAPAVLTANPGAPLTEIADHAHVPRATAYRHFPTREALVDVLRDEAMELGLEVLRGRLAPLLAGKTPDAGVAETIESVLDPLLALATGYGQVVASGHTSEDPLAERFIDLATALVARGQAQGEFITDIPAAALGSTLAHLVARTAYSHQRGDLDDRAAHGVIRVYLRGMTPAPIPH